MYPSQKMSQNLDTVHFAHWDDEVFDFEIEDSVLADIPREF